MRHVKFRHWLCFQRFLLDGSVCHVALVLKPPLSSLLQVQSDVTGSLDKVISFIE